MMTMKKKTSKKDQLYKEANQFFLDQKASEEGVVCLPNGIVYRKLTEGRGTRSPRTSSLVFVRYEGRLIDGTVFDSTLNDAVAPCFLIRDLIMGWQSVLCHMREGDKVECFLPYTMGYGKRRVDNIPGYSTLCFIIELVRIEAY